MGRAIWTGTIGFAGGAPRGEQAQIGAVADTGGAGVTGQEPGEGSSLGTLDRIVVADEHRSSG
jgi:hypothetical protein